MTIRLQFSARDSLSSAMIRAVTHSHWSHVDAVTEDGQLLGSRAEAIGNTPDGVQIRPSGYASFTALDVVTLDATPEQATAFWNFLMAQVGKRYDISAYDLIDEDRDWREGNAWCCSELIAHALEVAGVFPYPLAVPMGRVAPSDLLFALSVLVMVTA